MKSTQTIARVIAITLLLLIGINAICAGLLFILSPDGALLGLSKSLLQYSPFQDYLIPGIVLLIVNGIFNIIVAFLTIGSKAHYNLLISIQGILLVGWIFVQIYMLHEFNNLHFIMLIIGIILMVSGMVINPKKTNGSKT
jgi:hypothetical protein